MTEQRSSELAGPGALQAQDAALELFHIAVLLLGSEEEAVSFVEQALAKAEIDPCADASAAQKEARPRLVEIAVRHLVKRYPGEFAAPPLGEPSSTCIDTDDLSAAGLSSWQLASLLEGPERVKMREWLEQLPASLRAVFVLRAVAGESRKRTADILLRSGAQGWQEAEVGNAYRQALCLLASSLVSSSSAAAPV